MHTATDIIRIDKETGEAETDSMDRLKQIACRYYDDPIAVLDAFDLGENIETPFAIYRLREASIIKAASRK